MSQTNKKMFVLVFSRERKLGLADARRVKGVLQSEKKEKEEKKRKKEIMRDSLGCSVPPHPYNYTGPRSRLRVIEDESERRK